MTSVQFGCKHCTLPHSKPLMKLPSRLPRLSPTPPVTHVLYLSRLLAAWGDRLWSFLGALFMLVLQVPNSPSTPCQTFPSLAACSWWRSTAWPPPSLSSSRVPG